MDLNQTTLRGILAQILSVDKKYIVPKQGNWWNPQENQGNINNWCAYLIKDGKGRTVPFYHSENGQNYATQLKITTIDLQFVGPNSEDIANSVSFWYLREDVKEQFEQIRGSILPSDAIARSSVFYQDGGNTVLAWNTQIKIKWFQLIDTQQGTMPLIQLNGKINQ